MRRGSSDHIASLTEGLRLGTAYGVLVAVILLTWGLVISLRIYGAAGAPEQTNSWTPALLAPVIVVYLCSTAGLIWPRPVLWPLMPALIGAAACGSLIVHLSVEEAFRAYEPEDLSIRLFLGAPVAAFLAGVAESLRDHP